MPILRSRCAITLVLLFAGVVFSKPRRHGEPLVRTHCGHVRGTIEKGAGVFRGIPYAKPPVGSLRWQPPVPLSQGDGCWEGQLKANKFGSPCVQGQGNPMGAEDCLFLNVWTPQHALEGNASLPVVVWIHGGSLMDGSGSSPAGYMPSSVFVRATNVVAVSLNYRLNVFGFLALEALSNASSTKTSGNYGLHDQVAALAWVKANIEHFGGNPNQVTILGQSAGGTCVQGLLVSPLAKGLFQSAVFMSGSAAINKSLADASKDNMIFYTNTGCKTLDCLYKMDSYDLLNAVPFNTYPSWAGGDTWELPTKGLFIGALAVVDGVVIPKPTFEMIQSGGANDVPVIVGTTAQEVDISPKPFEGGWPEYKRYVKTHMDTFNASLADELNILYPWNASNTSQTPELLYSTMTSDLRVGCPDDCFAKSLAQYFKSPVHRYVLVQGPSPGAQGSVSRRRGKHHHTLGSQYAYHTWDVDALFNLTFSRADYPNFDPDQTDYGLVTTMQSWFRQFTHNHTMPTDWPSYPDGLVLMAWKYVVTSSYHSRQCKFFMDNGFAPYAWID